MDRMRSVPVVVALALLLCGCGTYSWYNPNVPPEITQRDSEACREQARQLVTWELMDDDPFWDRPGWRHHRAPWGPMTSGLAMEQDVYDRCMRSKGYALIKEPKAPSPAGP
jgi:hypothetical protein